MKTHIDLFSGIGGFALAAQWAGFTTIAFSEIDPYANQILKKHWPATPNLGDIRNITAASVADAAKRKSGQSEAGDGWESAGGRSQEIRLDLLTGGFPCQPFSLAGKRGGAADNRHLWPEMLRVIKECRPRWVLGENVPGIIGMELDACLSALEGAGYETGTLIIPACAVDAPHRRDRVWIVAHREKPGLEGADTTRQTCADGRTAKCGSCESVAHCESDGREQGKPHTGGEPSRDGTGPEHRFGDRSEALADASCELRDRCKPNSAGGDEFANVCCRNGIAGWPPEPQICRMANGVPRRVDRLKCLGNAIVPQVAYQLLKLMK